LGAEVASPEPEAVLTNNGSPRQSETGAAIDGSGVGAGVGVGGDFNVTNVHLSADAPRRCVATAHLSCGDALAYAPGEGENVCESVAPSVSESVGATVAVAGASVVGVARKMFSRKIIASTSTPAICKLIAASCGNIHFSFPQTARVSL